MVFVTSSPFDKKNDETSILIEMIGNSIPFHFHSSDSEKKIIGGEVLCQSQKFKSIGNFYVMAPVMGSGRVNPQFDGMPDPTDSDTGPIG